MLLLDIEMGLKFQVPLRVAVACNIGQWWMLGAFYLDCPMNAVSEAVRDRDIVALLVNGRMSAYNAKFPAIVVYQKFSFDSREMPSPRYNTINSSK